VSSGRFSAKGCVTRVCTQRALSGAVIVFRPDFLLTELSMCQAEEPDDQASSDEEADSEQLDDDRSSEEKQRNVPER
jgi:hypothetical protein